MYTESFWKGVAWERRRGRRSERTVKAYYIEQLGVSTSTLPFPIYLHMMFGTSDWRTLSREKLIDRYLEYRTDCVRLEMDFEAQELYGLSGL